MKILSGMLVLAAVLATGSAQAQFDDHRGPDRGGFDHGGFDHGGPGRDRGGWDRDHGRGPGRDGGWDRGHRDDGTVAVACAPEVIDGNVKATDRTLTALTKTAEFADASTFKAEVARIAAMKDSSAKTAQYLNLIGIDANNSEKVVEFIGARQVSSSQLTELQRNSGLSASQANTVAASLQSALKGGLQ